MVVNKLKKRVKKYYIYYLFLLPSLSAYVLFLCYPLARAIIFSLHRFTIKTYKFIGIKNYVLLFSDEIFRRALTNTCLFVIISVPVVLILSLLIAATLVKMKDKARTNFMGIFYLPSVTSIVTLCLSWKWIYDFRYGMLNYLLNLLGYENINWLASKYTALPSLILILIYIGLGIPIILHTTAISAIPKTYEDAARIDGANSWQVLWKITIPLVRPTTLYLLILETIGTFQVFLIVLLTTLGGPYYRTTTLAFQLTEEAFKFSHYGIASTYGIILLMVVGTLTIIQYKFLSKDIQY